LGGGAIDEEITSTEKVEAWREIQALQEGMRLNELYRNLTATGRVIPPELQEAVHGLGVTLGRMKADETLPEVEIEQEDSEELVIPPTQSYYDSRPTKQMGSQEYEKLLDDDRALAERPAKIQARENVAAWEAEDRRGSYEEPGDRIPISKLAAAPSSVEQARARLQSPAHRSEVQDWDNKQECWVSPSNVASTTGTRPKQTSAEQPPLQPRRADSHITAPPRPPISARHSMLPKPTTTSAASQQQSLATTRRSAAAAAPKSHAGTLASDRRASRQIPSAESLKDDASKQSTTEAKSMARSTKTARTPSKLATE
jgi:hypothetical protein